MIISRRNAITAGHPKYFTGTPCKNGHTTFRYTVSSMCLGCLHDNAKKTRKRLKDLVIKNSMGFIDVTFKIHSEDKNVVNRIINLVNESRISFVNYTNLILEYVTALELAQKFDKESS